MLGGGGGVMLQYTVPQKLDPKLLWALNIAEKLQCSRATFSWEGPEKKTGREKRAGY